MIANQLKMTWLTLQMPISPWREFQRPLELKLDDEPLSSHQSAGPRLIGSSGHGIQEGIVVVRVVME